MQIPLSILGESRDMQTQAPRVGDELATERSHGDRFSKLLEPKSRGEGALDDASSRRQPEREQREIDGALEAATPDAEESFEQTKQDEKSPFGGAFGGRSSEAFEQLVADLRVKNAREKLLLAPRKSTRVHKNLSSTHVARLALLSGQPGLTSADFKGPDAKATSPSIPSLKARGARGAGELSQGEQAPGAREHRELRGRTAASKNHEKSQHSDQDPAASENVATASSPQTEVPSLERAVSPREALDTIVSKLHRADQLPAREPASAPIITRQMLPTSHTRGAAHLADLAQAREQLVRMKATQTGGVLELDIGVEHAHKATLRLEVEDGKARAICRCRAPEAVAEAHKMVDSLRDVLARAGMELGEVDVRFEGGDGDRGDSHREASHENANNQAHTRAERERMREENEGLEVIVSGLVHVIG